MSLGYVLLGVTWFFALGFGSGVEWAARKFQKAATHVAAPADGGFWDDLNRRLEDPEFRKGYIKTSMQIQEIDEQVNEAVDTLESG
jgi:hypothetical protein